MFDKVFHRSSSDAERRFSIAMIARKPVTLHYIPMTGDPVLLAKETTTFKGVIDLDKETATIQVRFEGENLKAKKNTIKLEIEY
jgi:hypothetical protein